MVPVQELVDGIPPLRLGALERRTQGLWVACAPVMPAQGAQISVLSVLTVSITLVLLVLDTV